MLKLKTSVAFFAGCLLAFAITGCSKSEDSAPSKVTSAASSQDSLLAYVPADTPYLLVSLEAPPDDVQDKLEQHADPILRSYQQLIRTLVAENAAELSDDGDDESAERLLAISGPLTQLMTLEGMRGAGFGRDSTMVFYGEGLLPVLRVALTDGDLFETAMKQIEADSGESMETASIDDQSYRFVGNEDARVILALVGDDLVLSVVPSTNSDEVLRSVLGLALPDKSLAQTTILEELQDEYAFTSFYLGYIDIAGIANVFLDSQTGINALLLEKMEYDPAELSDVCRAEIRQMAGIAPRVVTGYTDFDAQRFVSNTVVELRPDIASGLAKLTAPVPGLGEDQGGLMTFGMSLNVMGAREFYSARLDAMEQEPFKCEHFAELQAGVGKGREMLQQPLPPVVYDFKGFLAVVEEIEGLDLASQTPPTSMDLWLLLAMDNVEGLVAMGSMFVPELGGLNLQTDGKAVPLNIPQIEATLGSAFVAMTESALAISTGEGMEERLPDALEASPSSPSPFMSTEMDASRYYSFLGEAMAMEHDDGDDAASPEAKEAMRDVMNALATVLDRIRVDIYFTERGIEMPSTAELKD